jgi:hypothetical protein
MLGPLLAMPSGQGLNMTLLAILKVNRADWLLVLEKNWSCGKMFLLLTRYHYWSDNIMAHRITMGRWHEIRDIRHQDQECDGRLGKPTVFSFGKTMRHGYCSDSTGSLSWIHCIPMPKQNWVTINFPAYLT